IDVMRETSDRTAAETRQHFEILWAERAAQVHSDLEARQSASLAEVGRASDQQIEQFRHQLEVIVNTASNAISAANEQSRTSLESFVKDTADRLRQAADRLYHTENKETT